MAVSCGFAASISLPCVKQRSYYCVSKAANNVLDLQRRRHGFKIAFTAEKRIHDVRRSVLVSCLGDHKTTSPVTGDSWERLVIDSKSPVLVEFYTGWCGPCRMVHRMVDEIATEYSGRLNCFVIDADHDFQLAENYDVKAVPTVLLFKDGEKRESILGTMPKTFYVNAIERILAS